MMSSALDSTSSWCDLEFFRSHPLNPQLWPRNNSSVNLGKGYRFLHITMSQDLIFDKAEELKLKRS